ncbi:MAG TPA: MFS transporter, partial [Bacteroidota bacterium]|nr:MFS transporter [Bacteroidota bacterium]
MIETSGRYDRRNFFYNASEGTFFVIGSSLISSQTVFPALIARMGGDNTVIGAFGVIVWLGLLLPQIFAARYTQTLPWKKPWAVRFGAAQRFVILCIATAIIFSGSFSASITLLIILSLFAINQILTGITTPGWFDMYAKLTPAHHRGKLIGTRTAFAGIGSFGCGFVLTWILARFGFPINYGIVFMGAFVFQFISILLQSRLVEEYSSKTLPRQPVMKYFKQLPGIVHNNPPFRSFLFASVFLIVATIPLNFFTVYGLKRFQGNESIVGQFTLAIVAGQFIGSLLIGFIADRFGNRLALLFASVA